MRLPATSRVVEAAVSATVVAAGALALSAFPRPVLTPAGLLFVVSGALNFWGVLRASVAITGEAVEIRRVRTRVVPIDQAEGFFEQRSGRKRHAVMLRRKDGPAVFAPVSGISQLSDTEARAAWLIEKLNSALRVAKAGQPS
jgi:hypothetical protein